MSIGSEFWHKEVIDFDLPSIAEQTAAFNTLYELFIFAIYKAKQNPNRPGWELRYDLTGWHEYKFFSKELPAIQEKPDMRFVYYYNSFNKNFYLLAVGLRNSEETRVSAKEHSIYYIAANRLKRTNQDCWQMIK
ncbi:hypothetical protein SAMN05216238_101271 [Lentibacillus persicus]|uniref:Uncharacterized protein n=1 Tax=Lentibacillus persicus TaxID=640948 RepID=A0A1I1S6X9_9BACI|nr:hypothetical protein [Lentibacillus persicus]SFD42269.1 hypothetical protein SAMN05216238_101271 [Lentibacillus persicus]